MNDNHTIIEPNIYFTPSTFFDVIFKNNDIDSNIDNGRIVFAKKGNCNQIGFARYITEEDDCSDYVVVCQPPIPKEPTDKICDFYNLAGNPIRVARIQRGDKYYLSEEGFCLNPSKVKDGTLVCVDFKSGKFDLWNKKKKIPYIGRMRSERNMYGTTLYSVAIITDGNSSESLIEYFCQ